MTTLSERLADLEAQVKALRDEIAADERPMVVTPSGSYPVPENTPPKDGTAYWAAEIDGPTDLQWDDDKIDRDCLKNGLVHLTEEAARQQYEVELAERLRLQREARGGK